MSLQIDTRPRHRVVDENRVGRFMLPLDVIEYGFEQAKSLIMSRCVIIRAEFLLHAKSIDYIAYCEDFAPVQQNHPAPLYLPQMNVKRDDGGQMYGEFLGWKRVA